MITPCPKTPNCVSSVDTDRRHFVRPLRFTSSAADAHRKLLNLLAEHKRARIVVSEESYIRTEFVSAVFGFVDDVEFHFDDRQKVIQVKSASRTGLYDLGVNRRRIETIRKHFDRGKTPMVG